MFANRFVRSTSRMPMAVRSFSAPSVPGVPSVPLKRGRVHKEKTFIEAWCMDVGAYPVMSVIGIAIVFAGGAGLYIALSHPDARWTKQSRGQIFRGELKDEGY